MEYKFAPNISRKGLLLGVSIAVIILSLVGIFISDITVALAAPFYAVLLLLDKAEKRFLAILIPACSVALDIIFNGILATSAIQFTIAGVLIAVAVRNNYRKSSLSAILTALFSAFIVINLVLYAFSVTGVYTIGSALEFYSAVYAELKSEAVKYMMSAFASSPAGMKVTVETVEAMVTSTASLVIAFIVIIGFFLSGVAIKCFTAFSVQIVEDESIIRRWHFTTGSVFAYAYAASALLNIFVTGNSVIAVAIANFYLIFMMPYAYIGFKLLRGYLIVSDRRLLILLLSAAAIIMFGIYALVPLSLFGVYAVIVTNRYNALDGN